MARAEMGNTRAEINTAKSDLDIAAVRIGMAKNR
jgi:hypothetical protein